MAHFHRQRQCSIAPASWGKGEVPSAHAGSPGQPSTARHVDPGTFRDRSWPWLCGTPKGRSRRGTVLYGAAHAPSSILIDEREGGMGNADTTVASSGSSSLCVGCSNSISIRAIPSDRSGATRIVPSEWPLT